MGRQLNETKLENTNIKIKNICEVNKIFKMISFQFIRIANARSQITKHFACTWFVLKIKI